MPADNERVELRGQCPRALVDVLDAIALGKGMDRNSVVVSILEEHANIYLHEFSVVHSVLRGNPLLAEAMRNRVGSDAG